MGALLLYEWGDCFALMGEFLCSDAKEPKIAGGGHDEISACPPHFICCPAPEPPLQGTHDLYLCCVSGAQNLSGLRGFFRGTLPLLPSKSRGFLRFDFRA